MQPTRWIAAGALAALFACGEPEPTPTETNPSEATPELEVPAGEDVANAPPVEGEEPTLEPTGSTQANLTYYFIPG